MGYNKKKWSQTFTVFVKLPFKRYWGINGFNKKKKKMKSNVYDK